MDIDMGIDSDSEVEGNSSNFVFSRPNIIPSPEKMVNFGIISDNIFGGKTIHLSDESAFTFAKPAVIENLDHIDESNKTTENIKSGKVHKSHHLSTQNIKKSSAFTQLEKNSKRKIESVKLEISKSITCIDVPDSLLVKSVAKEHFEKYGETLKITIRPKRKIITVYYSSKDDATAAFYKAGSHVGQSFKIEWTTSEILLKPKKKESIKGKIASILNISDDIKEELEAMQGLEYNLPDPQHLRALTTAAKAKVKKAKVVANKEIPKRAIPLIAKPALNTAKLVVSEKLVSKVETPVRNQSIKISSATIEELQTQIRQAGTTSEEKYKILDARDRLMRLKQSKQKSLATTTVTKGTCPDMCPEKERYLREFQRQLSSYEQMDSNEYKVNHLSAVKQYSRSSADQEEPMPHDLRPVKSLKMTMSYLLHNIVELCEDDDVNLMEWYHFLWDRMRSVRKDITQQELCCIETVQLLEQCARFHILCSERLCAEETSVFDPKINSENLTKCLQTLKYMYNDLRESGKVCKNEPEFRAYIILLNLNNGTFISELSKLDPAVQHSSEVKFALEIYSAIAMNNYSRFFKLVRKTSYLNGCILLRYFNQVRVKALSVMVKAYCRTSGVTEYPLYELIDILGFEDEEDVFELCSRTGLKYDKESLYIKLSKENFREPDGSMEQSRAYNLILSKRLAVNQSISQCIAGGNLPEKFYENYKPHSSFDTQGYLLPSSINAKDQNLIDPYEFMEEDIQSNEQKEIKTSSKICNTVDVNKQTNNFSRDTNSESSLKQKAELVLPAVATNKSIFTSNVNSELPKTIETKPFVQPIHSIFSKPSSTVFSAVSTNAPTLPTTSPFNMIVNKSIFSGSNCQSNLFKPATTVPAVKFKPDDTTDNTTSTSCSSNTPERTSIKRRMDDSESSAEKKSLLEKEDLARKQKELDQRIEAAKEKLKRLEEIANQSIKEYEQLEQEITEEICTSVIRSELDRIRLIETLSDQAYEGMFREICESILDEQLFVQDMLIEVERRMRDRLLGKYCRIWRQWAAKRRAQRREALDNTPVWLQPESIEERARKLYRPEQKLAIKYARESKKWLLEAEKEKTLPKHTPIQFIINVGLKENAKSLDVEYSQHNFWKMVISWPLLENRLTLWRHKKLINRYLSPEDYTLEPIIIQHKPSPHENLVICIRHFEGLIYENCLTGMDALLFIVGADEDMRSIERRLAKSVLSREKLMPIPLVVFVFGDEENNPRDLEVSPLIERLLESGYVSEYSVLYERSVSENVVYKSVQSAMLWLAINRSPAVSLEMDYLKRVFDDCLTEELWLRIQGHLSHDPRFSRPLNDPNFIINLHNEAVNHIMDIILDPESMSYTDFAPELKIYLNNKRLYPCTYEYFDSVWKHPEYRTELERIMSSFIFPPWKESWPIRDMLELHDAIARYCRQMLSYESSLSITNNIMSDLFLLSSHSESSYPSFADVILHVIGKKISDIGGNTRVVYNKSHMKHFKTLPWWFKSGILLDYLAQQDEENETFAETENVSNSQVVTEAALSTQMDFDFSNIDELNETYQQQDEIQPLAEFCRETRNHISDVQNVAKKLDKQLEEQKLRNTMFEARLKEALQDDYLNIDT